MDITTGGIPGVTSSVPTSDDEVMVNAALVARIEVLEAENTQLKACLSNKEATHFGIEHIKHDERLVFFLHRVQLLCDTYGILPLSRASCKQATLLGH